MQRLKSQRGQALVEFALILPIFLLLVIGVFDFGQAENRKNNLNFLANEAARFAEVNSCAPCLGPPAITINAYVANGADTSPPPSIKVCFPSGTHNVGDPIKVTASAPFTWLGTGLKGLPFGTITIESTVTARILVDPGSSPAYTITPC
ncbi:MAG TPA: TadE family protein [Gaiellaceae bacterium]|nr:TadE family protein [Gaiellaceae bacterium]